MQMNKYWGELWHDILNSSLFIKNLNPLFMLKTLGVLVAAAAAFGIYKYSKMTPQQKKDLKEKGKDFLDKKMRMGDLLAKKRPVSNF
jgi:hypothetical protein